MATNATIKTLASVYKDYYTIDKVQQYVAMTWTGDSWKATLLPTSKQEPTENEYGEIAP